MNRTAGILLLISGFAVGIVVGPCLTAQAQTLDDPLCYTEPTANIDASPLDDLQGCTIVSSTGGSETIAASSPNGGGTVCTTSRSVVGSVEGSVDFTATCADLLGNASGVSNTITRTFPGIAPNPPTLLP